MMLLKCFCQYACKFGKFSCDAKLEKVSFDSNPKEGQYQQMFKLLYNCTHFTCQQGYAQDPSSYASEVREPRTSRQSSWIYKRDRYKRSYFQHPLDHTKNKRVLKKTSVSALLTMPQPQTIQITTNSGTFLKRWEYETTLPAS